MAVVIDEVQAGRGSVCRVFELEIGDLQASLPQRGKPHVGSNLAAQQQRLSIESGIVEHLEVIKIKAWAGQQAKLDLPDLYLPSDCGAESSRKLLAEARSIDVGWKEYA